MKKGFFKKGIVTVAGAVTGVAVCASSSFAAFTMPVLPVADLETAGAVVVGLIATAVIIGAGIKLLRKAG